MVGACPDVDEDERPEVDDGKAVGIDGSVCCFRDEIIHDPENRGGEEEGDGVVAIPPLDEGVLNTAENRVGVSEGGGNGEVVDDVEQRDGDDGRDVEPEGDVERFFVTFREGPEEIRSKDDPDDDDGEVEGPDEFGVFLAAGESGGECDGGSGDDGLPAPEVDGGEEIRGGAGFAEALGGIIDASEDHVSDEGEDDCVRVERADATEGDVGETFAFEESEGDGFEKFPVHLPPGKLGGGEHADEHTDNAPEDGGGHETADGFVVVGDFFGHKVLMSKVLNLLVAGFAWGGGVEGDEGVVLEATAAGAARFHGKAHYENRGEARAEEDGNGEDVHAANEAGMGKRCIACLALDCAFCAGVSEWVFNRQGNRQGRILEL